MSLIWEEIKVNEEFYTEIPSIEKIQLVKYAGASGDFNMIHQDEQTARKVGLPNIIAHGMLSMGVLGEHVKEIAGDSSFVNKLKVQFKGMVFLGERVICKAVVTNKNMETREVELDIRAENEEGKIVTKGNASIKYY